jgi:hypothetical protein
LSVTTSFVFDLVTWLVEARRKNRVIKNKHFLNQIFYFLFS